MSERESYVLPFYILSKQSLKHYFQQCKLRGSVLFSAMIYRKDKCRKSFDLFVRSLLKTFSKLQGVALLNVISLVILLPTGSLTRANTNHSTHTRR